MIEIVAIIVGGMFMLSPVMVVRMIIAHRERMARITNPPEGAPVVMEEMAALRRELAQLRDTSTHYDLSFDAALSRVESRLHSLEAEKHAEPVRREADSYRTASSYEAETLHARR